MNPTLVAESPRTQPPALASDRDRLVTRVCWAAAFTLIITHIILAWLSRSPAVTPAANDDALYLLLARSLQSFHYLDSHILGSPGHSQYPPAFPAVLAVSGAIFGNTLAVAQITTVLFSAISLLLIFDLAQRYAGPVLGVLTLAPLVFSRLLLGYAGRVVTESPYMAFSFAAIWVLCTVRDSTRRYLFATILAILAGLTRSIGLSIIAAVFVSLLVERRFRWAAVFAVASSATVGAWLYWTTIAPTQFTERSYAAVTTTTAKHFSGPLGLVLTRSQKFVEVYIARSLGAGLQVPTIEGSRLDNIFWIVLLFAGTCIGLYLLRRKAPIIPLYFIAYCGVLLLYPYKLTRFFMPIAPLMLLSVFVTFRAIGDRWGQRLGLVLGILLSATLVATTAPAAIQVASKSARCDRSHATVSASCFAPDRLAFFSAVRFTSANIPADAAVVTIKEAAFSYYTGRKVIHPDEAIQRGRNDVPGYLEKRGVRYGLITPFRGGAEIIQPLLPYCEHVQILKDFGSRTLLLSFHPSERLVGNACETFRQLAASIQAEAESDNLDE
ncbi:MAG: glycosyltransferase family 39 protein [Gemmatimonadota bacterium]